ncbi:MAG TPA: hypothetical protein VN918_06510 [Myxococcaceae bacterium]|nr:hypothetical protein [Myxococcaceae bacterium]
MSFRSLIPQQLARRIDRASRAAHRFHRFAHHPLCHRYAKEVIAIGRRHRICRGCTFAILGLGCGLLAGWALQLRVADGYVVGTAAVLLGASGLRRLPKSATRLIPAFGLGWASTGSVGCALLAAGITAAAVLGYRRRGPYRGPCVSCPELGARVCSGFSPIVHRERAFQRLARKWMTALPRDPAALRPG